MRPFIAHSVNVTFQRRDEAGGRCPYHLW